MKTHTIKPALFLISAATLAGLSSATNAATYTALVPAVGAQCKAAGINNSGMTVGNCSPANPSAIKAPWVDDSTTAGGQLLLTTLVAGQPCVAEGIANSGKVVGECADANNVNFGASWDASSPGSPATRLAPLPGTILFPLLRPADMSTQPSAFNQRGGIVGSSISGTGVGTVVIYAATGGGTPQRVSDWGDNCVATSVNFTLLNGYPSIAMNCPNAGGTTTATVAVRSTAAAYSKVALTMPTGTTDCTVIAINDQSQLAGTCAPSSTTDVPETVFWSSPTATPIVLTRKDRAKNAAVDLNNLGHIVGVVFDTNGKTQPFLWDPVAGPAEGVLISPPTGAKSSQPIAVADNDTVALVSTDSNQYVTGCTWTPTAGTQCIAPLAGGKKSVLTTISQNGSYAAGVANDSGQNDVAIAADLP